MAELTNDRIEPVMEAFEGWLREHIQRGFTPEQWMDLAASMLSMSYVDLKTRVILAMDLETGEELARMDGATYRRLLGVENEECDQTEVRG